MLLFVVFVDRLFSRARELAEDPLTAAQAYENTAQAIHDAEQAALAAVNASDAAFAKVCCRLTTNGFRMKYCYKALRLERSS